MLRNLGIYAVGSGGSRLITIMLVPIYSFFIAPGEFGYYDICFMVVLVMMPFVTLQMRDGAFRFLIDSNSDEERRKVVTFTVLTIARSAVVCIGLGILLGIFVEIRYMWLTIAFGLTFSVYDVMQQMLRALGHNKLYAASGIISSFLIFFISVPLVVYTDMGVLAVFIGNIAGRMVSIFIVEWKVRMFTDYFSLHTDSRSVSQEMLKFSIPLIAVNVIIWGLSSGNRFFINELLSIESNGMYAVVVKFASILEALTLIFIQAWQETAIKQYQAADRNRFFSHVFNTQLWFMTIVVISVSFMARIFYNVIIGPAYQESVAYVYPLLAASMIMSLMLFFDVIYQCSKATRRQLPGLLVATVISLVGNYFFTLWWGLYGVVATLNVVYLTLVIFRAVETRRYVQVHISRSGMMSVAMLAVSGVVFYLPLSKALMALYLVVVYAVAIVSCPDYIKQFVAEKLNLKTNRQ
ncbi:MAG: lipopolysaccharide biosynthesis protein [Muribaculaceae bacterium]